MSNIKEVENSKIVNLLNLSRSNNFGAVRNDQPNMSQEFIDSSWPGLDLEKYDLTIGPMSFLGGIYKFKELSLYGSVTGLQEYANVKKIAFVGTLEYLDDVRPSTRLIRQLLISGVKVYLFIGFKKGYYSWTVDNAVNFINTMGIKVVSLHNHSDSMVEVELDCNGDYYSDYLRENRLPEAGFSHLMVTTEHSGYRVTGGIGSYVKECDNLYGKNAGILILDNNATLDIDKIIANNWLAPQMFLGKKRVDDIFGSNFDTYGDVIVEALECIVAIYPGIKSIESQEMLLNKSIDAKKMGYISADLKLITTCHGSSFHLAKAKRSVLDAENIHVAYREKYTIENSDAVILPTDFLRNSYKDSGINTLDDGSRVKKRLPFDVSRLPEGLKLEKYERFLYIGKTSTIKGFDLFLEALLEIYSNNPNITEKIKEVVIMATSVDITEPYLLSLYKKVCEIYNVVITSLDREVLLNTLAEYSSNTLALVTYRGDNHPLAVLELMAIGMDFIAANAAGTPELILPGYEEHNLAPPNASEYSRAVARALGSVKKRSKLSNKLRSDYLTEQKNINNSYNINSINKIPQIKKDITNVNYRVVVDLRGDSSSDNYKKTIESVNSQTYENIVIGTKKYTDDDLYLKLFAGDIIFPDAVDSMVKLFNSSANVGSVMVHEDVMSYEGDGRRRGFEEYHPYAPQLGSVFLQEKYNRRVIALFDKKYLDDTYSDWHKAISVACEGGLVLVVPRKLAKLVDIEDYYSNDKISHISKFSHSFTALPIFDASILYSELERLDAIYWGLNRIGHLSDHFVNKESAIRNVDISPKLIRIAGAYNRFTPSFVKRTVSVSGDVTFKVLRKIKRRLR